MISLRKALLLSTAVLVGSVTAASAADLGGYRGGSIKDSGYAPQAPAQSHGPAWYFRADVAKAWNADPYMVEDSVAELHDTRMNKSWSAGGGIGYYFNNHVRADFTYEHRFKSNVSGYRYDATQGDHDPVNNPGYGCHADADGATIVGTSACHGTRSFGLSSNVFLANLYYDFGHRGHFTPYIGAGLGVVHHKTHAGRVIDSGHLGDHGGATTGTIDAGSSKNVAGALMAGVSVQLRERMNLDVGYRFLYLGQTATGAVRDVVQASTLAPDPTVEGIHAHEIRLGLRYDIR